MWCRVKWYCWSCSDPMDAQADAKGKAQSEMLRGVLPMGGYRVGYNGRFSQFITGAYFSYTTPSTALATVNRHRTGTLRKASIRFCKRKQFRTKWGTKWYLDSDFDLGLRPKTRRSVGIDSNDSTEGDNDSVCGGLGVGDSDLLLSVGLSNLDNRLRMRLCVVWLFCPLVDLRLTPNTFFLVTLGSLAAPNWPLIASTWGRDLIMIFLGDLVSSLLSTGEPFDCCWRRSSRTKFLDNIIKC